MSHRRPDLQRASAASHRQSRLIGHRGEPRRWPENSLRGLRAALEAGACYVETDVQITADCAAILCHDDSLLKMTGHNLAVTGATLGQIRALPAGYPARFGDRFAAERIATLGEFAALLAAWPDARAFVEIKSASIQAFGVGLVVDLVLDAIGAVQAQCVAVSFEYSVLKDVRSKSGLPVGWVLPEWNATTRRLADALAPQYLFVNRRRVPGRTEPLWPGPWQWVVYTANRTADIERLFARGFDLVETDDIGRMMHELAERS